MDGVRRLSHTERHKYIAEIKCMCALYVYACSGNNSIFNAMAEVRKDMYVNTNIRMKYLTDKIMGIANEFRRILCQLLACMSSTHGKSFALGRWSHKRGVSSMLPIENDQLHI